MSTLEKVALFHQAFGIVTSAEVVQTPKLPSLRELDVLRLQSFAGYLHEISEEAFKFSAMCREDGNPVSNIYLRVQLMTEELGEVIEAISKKDIAAIAHELADLDYVVMGTILNLGLGPIHNRVVDEIHRANMSKLDAQGQPVLNEAGRVVKSEEFQEADVTEIVKGE